MDTNKEREALRLLIEWAIEQEKHGGGAHDDCCDICQAIKTLEKFLAQPPADTITVQRMDWPTANLGADRSEWLANQIEQCGEYGKEAADILRWLAGVILSNSLKFQPLVPDAIKSTKEDV